MVIILINLVVFHEIPNAAVHNVKPYIRFDVILEGTPKLLKIWNFEKDKPDSNTIFRRALMDKPAFLL